jgi:hypothetical protein
MTRPLAFTQASLCRAIRAARKEGLRVAGIRPDGTLIVHDGADTIAHGGLVDQDEMLSKWKKDVEA